MTEVLPFAHDAGRSWSAICPLLIPGWGGIQHMQSKDPRPPGLGKYSVLRLQQPLREDIKLYGRSGHTNFQTSSTQDWDVWLDKWAEVLKERG